MKALVLFAGIGQGLYCLLMFSTALFLILLILIQRGRGGGLSGAFGGGFGGQSAFGAKAGDTFTKVTIVAATFWIVLCLVGVKFLGEGESVLGSASVNTPNAAALNPDIDVEAADAATAEIESDLEATGSDLAPPAATDTRPAAENADASNAGDKEKAAGEDG